LVNALRAQLVEKDKEIKRLKGGLNFYRGYKEGAKKYIAELEARVARLQDELAGLGYTPNTDDDEEIPS
jgi:spermidine/putrescine-binding protein